MKDNLGIFFKLFYLSWIYTWISNLLVFTNYPAFLQQCLKALELIIGYLGKIEYNMYIACIVISLFVLHRIIEII